MVIPLILAVAGISTASVGAANFLSGSKKFKEAKQIGDLAYTHYQSELRILKADRENLLKKAEQYARMQQEINNTTIQRLIKLKDKVISINEKIKKLSLTNTSGIIERFFYSGISSSDILKGSGKSVATAVVANQGVLAIAGLIGVASTGTAISGLSGAAATSATLAWLGGGSLAVGGGGMALGSLLLGGVTIGPALMIGGFSVSSKAKQALEEAINYKLEVEQAIENIRKGRMFLSKVSIKIEKIGELTKKIEKKLINELDIIEKAKSTEDNLGEINKAYEKAIVLAKIIQKIQATAILNSEGKINSKINEFFEPDYIENFTKKLKQHEETIIRKRKENRKKILFASAISVFILILISIGSSMKDHKNDINLNEKGVDGKEIIKK